MAEITFDSRSIRVDDHPRLIISGAVHYPRSTPEQWPAIFERSKRAGLNTIETYVFWNLHERVRGQYDFTDRLDLEQFCECAKSAGLYVVLRIGPYICAETNFGGLPSWLRKVPDIEMRTDNTPFKLEMARFVTDVCNRLDRFFAPKGGPIILAQIENEYNNIAARYGDAGKRYLDWCVNLARSIIEVPLIMCVGAAEGAIETINGFYAHESIEDHFARNPDQPALWTEAYPGWYDTFGYARHSRKAEDIAFAAAHFFAMGGSGINYYMWHGGTNFGRETMYLQTPAYFPNAPLDEFGRETTTSRHLGRLHHLLLDHSSALLSRTAPLVENLGLATLRTFVDGDDQISFLSNPTASPVEITFDGDAIIVHAKSVQLYDRHHRSLYDSATIEPADEINSAWIDIDLRPQTTGHCPEPMPVDRQDPPLVSPTPLEQLSLTQDTSDYCWYSTTINGGRGKLEFQGAADFLRVFVDSQLVATSPLPLMENRSLTTGDGFSQCFELDLSLDGPHRLDVLCTAVGLIKGDWMLDANMARERKGLIRPVVWRGAVLKDWLHYPRLVGETSISNSTAGLNWLPGTADRRLPTWWRLTFSFPPGESPVTIDLTGLEKGLIWLNQRCVSRFWLAPSAGRNPISPGAPVEIDATIGPTQRFYHLPRSWMVDRNELIIFDESGAAPTDLALQQGHESPHDALIPRRTLR